MPDKATMINIAEYVRAWYTLLRRTRERSTFRTSSKYNHIWIETAKKIISDNVDVATFMQSQFTCQENFPWPEEMYIGTARSWNIYVDYLNTAESKQRLAIKLQANKVRYAMLYENLKNLLVNRSEEISALFRVSIAYSKQYTDIIQEFLTEATCQYLRNKTIYDKVYKENDVPIAPEVSELAKKWLILARMDSRIKIEADTYIGEAQEDEEY
jgi:hypothetical protein